MKKFTYLASALMSLTLSLTAQNFNPVTVTGYNQDGIAEANPPSSTTSTGLDGSGYILYSTAYGVLYNTGLGLPTNGTFVSGNRTYKIPAYTGNNLLYVPGGFKDSLVFTTPAPYSAISLMGFATDGSSYADVTVVYTDGTTEVFYSEWFPDWFGWATTIISGFDRASRSTGAPDGNSFYPNMYPFDFYLSCSNQTKNVSRIVIDNSANTANICIFAASAATPSSYNITGTNLSCNSAGDGAVAVTPTGGTSPFTYSWTASTATTSAVSGLSAGSYTVYILDGTGCDDTLTKTITEPAPVTIPITASANNVCAGTPISLSTMGANTFTWSTGANYNMTTVTPTATTVYTVSGTTAQNCYVQGSITLNINPLPPIAFVVNPVLFCHNSPNILLNATPGGGTFSGPGIFNGNLFNPVAAGIGTHTLTYTYTDATTNCTNVKQDPITIQFCTGIDELSTGVAKVFPNPATEQITMELNNLESADLIVLDITGKQVAQFHLKSGEQANIATLVPGIYFYNIIDQGITLGHGKLMKQ